MAGCLVPNCKSRTKFKSLQQFKDETELGKSISFFSVPSSPRMQSIWRSKLFDKQASDIKLSQESKICEKHFASTDFIKYNYNDAILKETAEPKLCVKPIDWIQCAKSRLDGKCRDIEKINTNWLPFSGSIKVDRNVKCRFCLKTKKEVILNCWQEISTPKFKEMYLQVTGSEIHTSDKLPQFCCICCYDRLNEAADTMVHFQKCHLKWQKVLQEIQKQTVDSLQVNKNYLNDAIELQIEDLSLYNNCETIKDVNIDNNESHDVEKTILPEMLNANSGDNIETMSIEDENENDECSSDKEKLNGDESTPIKKKPKLTNKRICLFCSEAFNERSTFVRHMKEKHNEHFSKKESLIICFCSEAFKDRLSHLRHMKEKHNGKFLKKVYRCDYCALKYPSELQFKTHLENHHAGQPLGSMVCQLCPGKRYTTKTGYARHIYFKHSSLRGEAIVNFDRPAVNVECTICKKVSKSAELLVKHMYLVHKPRTIPCDECDQMFVNQFKKKLHMVTHTGERLFVCETCGVKFLTKYSLRNHQKCVHDNVDRRRRTSSALASLPCTICDKKYLKLKNIKRHMEQVHKEISKQEWQLLSNRSCVRCNFIFENEEYLEDHRKNTCNGIVR